MSVGSAETHAGQRKRLRKKMRQQGCSEAEIAQAVEVLRARQEEARRRGVPLPVSPPKSGKTRGRRRVRVIPGYSEAERQAIEDATYARLALDDRAHRRSHRVDPLLTGAARATGATAKAVQRRKGVTGWQYDEMTKTVK